MNIRKSLSSQKIWIFGHILTPDMCQNHHQLLFLAIFENVDFHDFSTFPEN